MKDNVFFEFGLVKKSPTKKMLDESKRYSKLIVYSERGKKKLKDGKYE